MSSKGGCDEEEALLSGTKYERKRGCKLNDIKCCGKCRWSVRRKQAMQWILRKYIRVDTLLEELNIQTITA
jgi:hypothetical protein